MKSLFSFSANNNKFLFQNEKKEVVDLVESLEKDKELLKVAQGITKKQYNIEVADSNLDDLKKLAEIEKNGSKEEIKIAKKYLHFDPTFNERFISNPSMIKSYTASWYDLVKNSNEINSAKLTTGNSELMDSPDIWNLLKIDSNFGKVAKYLEDKFGMLKLTDKLGVWYDYDENGKGERMTRIYFERDGEKYVIPFNKIK